MSKSIKEFLKNKGILAELEDCRNEEEAINVLKRENLWGIINYTELEELKESYKNGEIEADGTLSLGQLDEVAGGLPKGELKNRVNSFSSNNFKYVYQRYKKHEGDLQLRNSFINATFRNDEYENLEKEDINEIARLVEERAAAENIEQQVPAAAEEFGEADENKENIEKMPKEDKVAESPIVEESEEENPDNKEVKEEQPVEGENPAERPSNNAEAGEIVEKNPVDIKEEAPEDKNKEVAKENEFKPDEEKNSDSEGNRMEEVPVEDEKTAERPVHNAEGIEESSVKNEQEKEESIFLAKRKMPDTVVKYEKLSDEEFDKILNKDNSQIMEEHERYFPLNESNLGEDAENSSNVQDFDLTAGPVVINMQGIKNGISLQKTIQDKLDLLDKLLEGKDGYKFNETDHNELVALRSRYIIEALEDELRNLEETQEKLNLVNARVENDKDKLTSNNYQKLLDMKERLEIENIDVFRILLGKSNLDALHELNSILKRCTKLTIKKDVYEPLLCLKETYELKVLCDVKTEVDCQKDAQDKLRVFNERVKSISSNDRVNLKDIFSKENYKELETIKTGLENEVKKEYEVRSKMAMWVEGLEEVKTNILSQADVNQSSGRHISKLETTQFNGKEWKPRTRDESKENFMVCVQENANRESFVYSIQDLNTNGLVDIKTMNRMIYDLNKSFSGEIPDENTKQEDVSIVLRNMLPGTRAEDYEIFILPDRTYGFIPKGLTSDSSSIRGCFEIILKNTNPEELETAVLMLSDAYTEQMEGRPGFASILKTLIDSKKLEVEEAKKFNESLSKILSEAEESEREPLIEGLYAIKGLMERPIESLLVQKFFEFMIEGNVKGSSKVLKLSTNNFIKSLFDLCKEGYVPEKLKIFIINELMREHKEYEYTNMCICGPAVKSDWNEDRKRWRSLNDWVDKIKNVDPEDELFEDVLGQLLEEFSSQNEDGDGDYLFVSVLKELTIREKLKTEEKKIFIGNFATNIAKMREDITKLDDRNWQPYDIAYWALKSGNKKWENSVMQFVNYVSEGKREEGLHELESLFEERDNIAQWYSRMYVK